MVGLWLSLNVLSFQTSLETWTTAAIIFGGWSLRSHCKFGNESEAKVTASQDIGWKNNGWAGE